MEDKWAFLQPWREALRQCKALHDSLDVEDSREFRASRLPVQVSIRCWPSLPKGYELLAGRCSIPVPFPADAALRGDSKILQRVREAMELFNVLAAVSRPAFLQLLAEFVVVADNFNDMFTPDFIFVYPVWECYLAGTLGSKDVVATGASVTWGQLFGCSKEPTEYSSEFRVAMDTLEVMRRELKGVLCDFMGRQATVEWSDPGNAIEWTAQHVAIPTKGVQVACKEKDGLEEGDVFSQELGAMFEITVPPVVQLCAVTDSESVLEMWEHLPLNPETQTVETMKPRFSAHGVVQLTTALSRMNLKTLRLDLDEVVDSVASFQASANAGFLLSSLVCGRSMCASSRHYRCASPLVCRGTISDLEVTFAGNSAAGPAGICSVVAESSTIQTLTLNMGTLGDQVWWLNQVRWGWLAYALWSHVSNTSIQSARLTNIHLTRATVASVADSVTNCYPPSTLEQNMSEPSSHGYINIQKGTKIRPCGLEDSDNSSIVMDRICHCRARYDSKEMGGQAEVVIPGYGVCTVQLGIGVNMYVPDSLSSRCQVKQSRSIRSLTLEFFEIEDPSLVSGLLSLIGGNLRSLKMGMFWTGRRRSVLLDCVAAACPQLEELYLTGFDVVLSSSEELRDWGLTKLVIQSCEAVHGLLECLSDSTYRMSRELVELEVTLPRAMLGRAGYANSLTEHNGDYLAVTKDKLPLASKAAMISVVDGAEKSTCVKAVCGLEDILMGFVFAFAAIPMRRVVRVISSSS